MIDALHARVRASRTLQRFTAVTRILLAVGFIPPGLTKVLGHPFTKLPPSHPVGYFFDAFFQADAFYRYVGVAQVLAGLLLLAPRTATLGAVVYFPIILTIAVVTLSIGFKGTWVITLLMTLACLYLLLWDYDRLKGLLPVRLERTAGYTRREYATQAGMWMLASSVTYGLMALVGVANLWASLGEAGFALAAAAGAGFGLSVAGHVRGMSQAT